MSDVMFFGVLRMPCELAMSDELSRYQFYQRVQEAADRIEQLEAELKAREGWKLVPIEPTNEMWDAAVNEQNRVSANWPTQHASCFQIYKAMIAAAPNPPSAGSEG